MNSRPSKADMDAADWGTSSYSGGGGNECVEVTKALVNGWVCVRDSKNRQTGALAFVPEAWGEFLAAAATDGLVPVTT